MRTFRKPWLCTEFLKRKEKDPNSKKGKDSSFSRKDKDEEKTKGNDHSKGNWLKRRKKGFFLPNHATRIMMMMTMIP